MTEQEEFEFRLRLEREREQQKPEMPTVMKTMGNLAAGAIRGAGSIGATLLTPYDYLAGNTKSIGNPERRKDMDNALSSLGFDTDSNAFGVGKFGAELAGTASIPVARAGGIFAKTGKNALAAGAGAGLVNPEDAGTGALIGGAAVPVARGIGAAAEGTWNRVVRPLADLVSDEGPANILQRYITNKVGEKNIPATVKAAQAVQDILPGGKPTLPQAVAGVPEGSPLQALGDITARTAGGPSAKFGQIVVDQAEAVTNAKAARQAKSAVNYGKAFDPALHRLSVDAELASIAQNPYFESVAKTADKVAQAKGLNPQDNLTEILHYVKVGLDKKLKPGFGEVPIDNAERGAVLELKKQLTDWLVKRNPDYKIGRAEHEKASKLIDAFTDRAELAKNPLQPTALGGGVNIAEETRQHIPNLLSRAAMASNFLLRTLGKRVEPKVDELAAEVFSNPQAYADLMSRTPPNMRFQLDKALRSANALAVMQAD